MPLIPLRVKPGVYANGGEYEAAGRWLYAPLMRWYEGILRPVGGWERITGAALAAPARAILPWRDNLAVARTALGTASNLYYHDGSAANDITPDGLTPGFVDAFFGSGFGIDAYGADAYGTPRSDSNVITPATTWSIDNLGQVLLALSSTDGKLYQWDPGTLPLPAKASVVSAAPVGAVGMFVTDERMVVLIGGGGNPRELQWCNQQDTSTWTADESNTAGDLQLNTNGLPQVGYKMPGEYLIHTDTDLHVMTYVGYPYIYGARRLASACGIIGPKAWAATNNFSVWIGNQSFYWYNGTVQPLPCEVAKAVFDNLDTAQVSKICGGINSQFSEAWFFFPSVQGNGENDSYVFWNYKDNHWGLGLGALGRTAWADKDVWPHATAAGADSFVYEHESGWTDAGLTRAGKLFAESAPIDLTSGTRTMDVVQIIPDKVPYPADAQTIGSASISFKTAMTPNGIEILNGPYPMRSDGYTDARFSGRQVKLRYDLAADGLFQLGTIRLDAQPGSGR